MASTVRPNSSADYFKSKRPQNIVTTYWEDTPYTTDAAVISDSCDDDTLPSPTSPLTATFPQAYSISKEDYTTVTSSNPKRNQAQSLDSLGSYEDWMRWDDPSDAALSPTSDFFPELKVEAPSPSLSGLDLPGSSIGNNINIEDTAIFGEDPITEEPLFQTSTPFIAPTQDPREGLYSTPLSWTRPLLGRRSESYALSPQEETKLRNIAMPSQQSQQYPASPNSSNSSPEPSENNRKRKSSVEDDEEDDNSPPARGPVKKTAHNMIEKRYRTNLNDKIAALRDSVPSLRVMSKKNSRGEVEIQEDLQGLTPAHKLNKATVLSKATEYIAHLEKRNKNLAKENANLKSRVDAFEILVMARQGPIGGGVGGMKQQRTPSLSRQHMQRPAYSMDFGPI